MLLKLASFLLIITKTAPGIQGAGGIHDCIDLRQNHATRQQDTRHRKSCNPLYLE